MQRTDFRFLCPFRVRYSEVDGQIVVFYAHYLTYLDTSITEFFRCLDYDSTADVQATVIDFHTAKSVVEDTHPTRLAGEVERAGVQIFPMNPLLRWPWKCAHVRVCVCVCVCVCVWYGEVVGCCVVILSCEFFAW